MKKSNQALDALSQSVFPGTAWWSACIAGLQFMGAVLEYWRQEPVLLWLDVLSGCAGAGAAAVSLCRLPVGQKRILVTVFVSLSILFEVETAFHDPDYTYYDSRQYLIVIVAMLFLGIVFPGRPVSPRMHPTTSRGVMPSASPTLSHRGVIALSGRAV